MEYGSGKMMNIFMLVGASTALFFQKDGHFCVQIIGDGVYMRR